MSQMSQGRYYPIHDQSGEVTWHAQRWNYTHGSFV
jgi:hypothetical protein